MPTTVASKLDPSRLDSRKLLQVLTAVKRGDFSARLPDDWTGLDGKIADTVNEIRKWPNTSSPTGPAQKCSASGKNSPPGSQPRAWPPKRENPQAKRE